MNGGAIVVFLTFVSHLLDNKVAVPAASIGLFAEAVWWFIGGIGLTLLSYCTIFLTNGCSRMNWIKLSWFMFGLTLVFGAGSLVCFFRGGLVAITAFRTVTSVLAR